MKHATLKELQVGDLIRVGEGVEDPRFSQNRVGLVAGFHLDQHGARTGICEVMFTGPKGQDSCPLWFKFLEKLS